MNVILALLDASPTAAAVARNAEALGRLLDLDVERVEAIGPDPERSLMATISDRHGAYAVLASRSSPPKPDVAGHVAQTILTGSAIPLVVIPPVGRDLPDHAPRLLLPLDGNHSTDVAVLDVADDLIGAGATVSGLHVFDSSTVPPFVGSAQEIAILAEEFFANHMPHHTVSCELRIGEPGPEILSHAEVLDVDAIIIAWSQDLSEGRGKTLRQLLRATTVPLILVPVQEPSEFQP